MRSDDAMPHNCRRLSANIPYFISHIHDNDIVEGRSASNINSRQDRSGIDNLLVHSIWLWGLIVESGEEERKSRLARQQRECFSVGRKNSLRL